MCVLCSEVYKFQTNECFNSSKSICMFNSFMIWINIHFYTYRNAQKELELVGIASKIHDLCIYEYHLNFRFFVRKAIAIEVKIALFIDSTSQLLTLYKTKLKCTRVPVTCIPKNEQNWNVSRWLLGFWIRIHISYLLFIYVIHLSIVWN